MLPKFTLLQKGVTLLLILSTYTFPSSAKTTWADPPLSVVEEGQAPSIDLAFSYGSEANPVPASSSLNLVYNYSGYTIDEAESSISVDLQNSWFGNASQINTSYSIDHETREVNITLTRTDGLPIGGYGFTVRLKGIIVVVGDIHRQGWEDFNFNAYYSTDSESLLVRLGGDYGPLMFSLYGLNGGLIAQKDHIEGDKIKWNVGNLSSQIYVLEMKSGQSIYRKKIYIGR